MNHFTNHDVTGSTAYYLAKKWPVTRYTYHHIDMDNGNECP